MPNAVIAQPKTANYYKYLSASFMYTPSGQRLYYAPDVYKSCVGDDSVYHAAAVHSITEVADKHGLEREMVRVDRGALYFSAKLGVLWLSTLEPDMKNNYGQQVAAQMYRDLFEADLRREGKEMTVRLDQSASAVSPNASPNDKYISERMDSLVKSMADVAACLSVVTEAVNVKKTVEQFGNIDVISRHTATAVKDAAEAMSQLSEFKGVLSRMQAQVDSLNTSVRDIIANHRSQSDTYYVALDKWNRDVEQLSGRINGLCGRMASTPVYVHSFTEQNITREVITSFVRVLGAADMIPPATAPDDQYRNFYRLMYFSVLGFVPERVEDDGRIAALTNEQLLACYNWLYNYAQLAAIAKFKN